MDFRNVIYFFCLLMSIGNIIFSIIYIMRIKSYWRYIKISYIFSNTFVAVLIIQKLLGKPVDGNTQLVGLFLILMSMFSGLVVSQMKVIVSKKIDELSIVWKTQEDGNS